jgi:DNA processing protein
VAERDEALDWVALAQIPGVGDETYRRLLAAFGTPDRIFSASAAALRSVVSAAIATAIATNRRDESLQRAAAWLQEADNRLVTLADPDYPQALLQIADPPPFLYVKGTPALLNRQALGIVGSRNATPQACKDAELFARSLSGAGLCVVSGLALGVDAAAHRGGLAGPASSIAVIGTGIDIVYPAANRSLAHQLAQFGAVVSEFPLGTPSKAGNFPRRNRIISGLSRGVLVVEAALQSGSLITARLAAEQGREVFAMPGSIHSTLSKGCHKLIKQGAKLVESAQDILEELGATSPPRAPEVPRQNDTRGDTVLQALAHEPCSVDVLVERTGLTADRVSSILLELELEGRVAPLPGGLYQAIY